MQAQDPDEPIAPLPLATWATVPSGLADQQDTLVAMNSFAEKTAAPWLKLSVFSELSQPGVMDV